ncbi:MAG: hypothetical protein ACYDEQ_15950 [Desulfocucumaceae bacterium]
MENARQLDERLRRIIREVSARTGSEMRVQMVEEFSRSMDRQVITFMSQLKKSLDDLE